MFQTLETTWDRSSSRRWSTLASFTMQALALSLLLAVPLLWVEGPPRLRWIDSSVLTPPTAPAAPAPLDAHRATRGSEMHEGQVPMPQSAPNIFAPIDNSLAPPAPGISDVRVSGGSEVARRGVLGSMGDPIASILPPPIAKPARLLRVSTMAVGNLAYRVQPAYPPLARSARVQGEVRLRAIISKAGVIENLEVLNGPPMLVKAAVEAVKQWRYRPYMLNGEPIEVETEITVNFTLGGG
jgi:periplasmic protein TonB